VVDFEFRTLLGDEPGDIIVSKLARRAKERLNQLYSLLKNSLGVCGIFVVVR